MEYVTSYLFHTYFILASYFKLPKGPWHPEAGLGPGVGPPLGPWPGPPQGAKGPLEAQSMEKYKISMQNEE